MVTVQATPSSPRSSTSVTRTSQPSLLPQRRIRWGSVTVFSSESSPLSTAMPSGARFSNISHLARRMPCRVLPKFSMCASPTLVMTAMSGRTISPKYRISPKWFMPVSMTAA